MALVRCAAAGAASVSDAAAVRAKSVVRMVNSGVRVMIFVISTCRALSPFLSYINELRLHTQQA
jgi:hypothetical protein